MIETFAKLEVQSNEFYDVYNVWNDLYKDWVIFLKQLINNQNDALISTKLPVINFVKLICKIIIE